VEAVVVATTILIITARSWLRSNLTYFDSEREKHTKSRFQSSSKYAMSIEHLQPKFSDPHRMLMSELGLIYDAGG
jgi:hypothetical protein